MGENTKRIWVVIFLLGWVGHGYAQEINEEYVYGCEYCTITEFRVVGKHKILFDYSNIARRKIILLDTQNLVVDRIQVEAPMNVVPWGRDKFLVPDLNYSAVIKIERNKLNVEKLAIFRGDFSKEYGSYQLIQPDRGLWSIAYTTCGANKYVAQLAYLPLRQKNLVTFGIKNPYEEYGARGKLTPYFSIKNLLGKDEVNLGLEQYILANKDCQEQIRIPAFTPGFHSYDIDEDKMMVFLKDFQKLFYYSMDSIPRFLGSIELPLPETGGWRHFYDLAQHLSYFVFEKKAENNSSKSKTVLAKTYKLYRLDGSVLTKIADLSYLPVDIEDNRLYELRSDKKSYSIYGHYLVPVKDDIQRIFIDH